MKRLCFIFTLLIGLSVSAYAQEQGKVYFYKLTESIGARISGEKYCVVYLDGSKCSATVNCLMDRSMIDRDLGKDHYYYEKFLGSGNGNKLEYESKNKYNYSNANYGTYYGYDYEFSSNMQQLKISKYSGKGNDYDNYKYTTYKYVLVSKEDLVGASSYSSASSNHNIRNSKNSRANRHLPFSLAYCLDGTSQNISTREIMRQNPAVGYMTFYNDKIHVDNEVYKYRETKDGVKIYQGNTTHAYGGTCIPLLFVNPDYNIINLFLTVKNSAGKDVGTFRSIVYLMEVDEFNTLWNQNNGVSTNLFVTNSDISHTDNVSNYSSSGGSKSYYNSNYGWKDCHICRGSGVCPTCNGDGIMDSGFGNGSTKCANCSTTAPRKGVCWVCQGKGKVYGIKY